MLKDFLSHLNSRIRISGLFQSPDDPVEFYIDGIKTFYNQLNIKLINRYDTFGDLNVEVFYILFPVVFELRKQSPTILPV
jgi:hypothetical protein